MARGQSLLDMASFASPYRRCADQPTVSSCRSVAHAPSSAAMKHRTSKLKRMREKNYNADWDAAFAAPMTARVPPELGGLRLDQALARLFPQYSRNRLQAWLKSGHITIEGRRLAANHAVSGGEQVALQPPRVADAAAPQAQRMPLKIVFEDAALIVIDKPPRAGRAPRRRATRPHAPQRAACARAVARRRAARRHRAPARQ